MEEIKLRYLLFTKRVILDTHLLACNILVHKAVSCAVAACCRRAAPPPPPDVAPGVAPGAPAPRLSSSCYPCCGACALFFRRGCSSLVELLLSFVRRLRLFRHGCSSLELLLSFLRRHRSFRRGSSSLLCSEGSGSVCFTLRFRCNLISLALRNWATVTSAFAMFAIYTSATAHRFLSAVPARPLGLPHIGTSSMCNSAGSSGCC